MTREDRASPDSRDRVLGRLAKFAPMPLLSLLAPLVALPIVARFSSHETWAALGIGQSAGAFLAIAAAGGWPLSGPVTIAGLPAAQQYAFYVRSVQHRALLYGALAPAAGVVSAVLAPSGHALVAVATTVGVGASALSTGWFAAGVGRAGILAAYDLVPKLALSMLSVGVIVVCGPEWIITYPIGIMVASAGGCFWFLIASGRRLSPDLKSVGSVRAIAIDKASSTFASALAATYTSTSVAVVSAVSGISTTAHFSSAFRMYSISLQGVVVVSQVTQMWARRGTGATPRQRTIAFWLYAAAGLGGCIAFSILGAPASIALFGESLSISTEVSKVLGVAFLLVSLGTYMSTQVVLPIVGSKVVLLATAVAAAAGILVTACAASALGAVGGAYGVLSAEASVMMVYVIATRRTGRVNGKRK